MGVIRIACESVAISQGLYFNVAPIYFIVG